MFRLKLWIGLWINWIMFAFNFLIPVKREMRVKEIEETLQFYIYRGLVLFYFRLVKGAFLQKSRNVSQLKKRLASFPQTL